MQANSSSAYDALLQQAFQLTTSQRADFAHQLLCSLEPEATPADSNEAFLQELARRSDAYSRGEIESHDWRESAEIGREELRRLSGS